MADNQHTEPLPAFDVVVIGGGFVGLSFAAMLLAAPESASLKVALVGSSDAGQATGPLGFDPRVFALSPRTELLLHEAGIWASVRKQRLCPYDSMYVWDGDGNGHIEFRADEAGLNHLGHIVENAVLVRALEAQVTSDARVHALPAERFAALQREEDGVQVILDSGTELSARLVIGADGANSRVRRQAGIGIRSWGYDQQAIVTTLRCERPHGFCARQRFAPEGPLALLPLTDNHNDTGLCSLVWSLDDDVAQQKLALNDEAFCEALTQASESVLGRVIEVDPRHAFPLRQRHATDYGVAGVILIGDAAHTLHPLAGQGANLGIYDAAALVDEICRAVRRRVPLAHSSLVSRYERQRKPHNLAAMTMMEGFKRGFGSEHLVLRWLRNEGLNGVDAFPPVKHWFSRAAAGQL